MKKETSLKGKTVKGVLWSSIERFSVQGLQFVIMIIMARLLNPDDYGLIGMLSIFLAVSQSLIDSGFSQALIRKQDRTQTDNSTVFFFNIIVGIVLYLALFFMAPFIAEFYDMPILVSITRILGIGVFINSLAIVQRALLTIKIDFKTQAKASLVSTVISGISGITLAYSGIGVWAIVVQQLLNLSINTTLLWFMSGWKPSGVFSWISFKSLFSFGSKLLVSGLIDTVYKNLYLIVIGKKFAAADLGYYTRASQFADFPSSNLTGIIQRVTFPVLCNMQNDKEKLQQSYRKILRLSAYIIFPLMIGLAAVAHPFILLLLKEQWAFTIELLQILCFSMMWYPIHAINLNLLEVEGRSDLFLRLEIIKKCLGVCILCITIPLGIKMMCIGLVCSSLICLTINTYYTGKLIKVGFFKQMRDLLPILLYSLSMGIIVYFCISFIESNMLQLFIGILVGALYYVGISIIFRSKEFLELKSIVYRNGQK